MRFRSILTLVLAAIALFVVSCSSPQVTAKGPLYSSTQLEQIQKYATEVETLRERILEIPPLVQKGNWVDVQSFIHGPLGELRVKMSRLARELKPSKVQAEALESAKEVFKHLNLIDEATVTRDSRKALFNYNEALRDFEVFLKYLPQNL